MRLKRLSLAEPTLGSHLGTKQPYWYRFSEMTTFLLSKTWLDELAMLPFGRKSFQAFVSLALGRTGQLCLCFSRGEGPV
jgi:hypothetical protein